MLVAANCAYEISGDVIRGRDAIVDSYRRNADSARRRFDEVRYSSVIEASGPASAIITFTDRVRFGETWHEFHCRQHVRVGAGGLIDEIRHEELPGERERLEAFENGARRDGGPASST
jgi:hypothetical protein